MRGAVLEDAAGGLEVAQDVAIAIVGDGRNDFGLLRGFGLPLACLGEVLEFEAHLLAEDGEHRIVWLDNGLRAEGTLAEDIGRAEVFPVHCRQFAGRLERSAHGLVGFPEYVRPVEGVGIERAAVIKDECFCHRCTID